MSDFQNLINYWQNSLSLRQCVDRKPGQHTDMHQLIIGQLSYAIFSKKMSFEAADLLIRSHLTEHESSVDRISNTVNPEFDYAESALKFAGCHKQNSKLWKSSLNATALLKDLPQHSQPNQSTIPDEAVIDLLAKHLPADVTPMTEDSRKESMPALAETRFPKGEFSNKIPAASSQNFKRHLTSPDYEASPNKANKQDFHAALRQQLCISEDQVNSLKANSGQQFPKESETKNHSGEMITFKTAKQQYLKNQQKRVGQPNSRSLFLTKNRPTHQFCKPSKTASDTKDENEICFDDKMKHIDPKMVELMMSEIMDHGLPVKWDDIAGLEFAKTTIKEIVIWPMLRPDLFTGLRGPPKGVLLFGPPGTGKTLIGKCIASQTKSTFFSISASSLTSKWIGEGEKLVKALFIVARCHQPAVIFIDEIDSLLTQRSESEHESSRRIKTEFLVQLDGATTSSNERLLVIGATNRPQELDEALRRRLVKRLYIPLPELEARGQIVRTLLKNHAHSLSDNDFDVICENTDGYSGSDVANLCKEAALGPIRRLNFSDIEHINEDEVEPIILKDFTDALKQVRASVSQKDLQGYVEWNEKFGSSAITIA